MEKINDRNSLEITTDWIDEQNKIHEELIEQEKHRKRGFKLVNHFPKFSQLELDKALNKVGNKLEREGLING